MLSLKANKLKYGKIKYMWSGTWNLVRKLAKEDSVFWNNLIFLIFKLFSYYHTYKFCDAYVHISIFCKYS